MSDNTLDFRSKDGDFLFFHSSTWGNTPIMTILVWTVGIFFVIPPVIWLISFLLMKNTTIRIEGNSLIYNGFQAISAVQKEIAIDDIKAVEVQYSITQMMFGKKYGTLKIATAGTTGYEVEMYGVRDADELRKIWRNRKG